MDISHVLARRTDLSTFLVHLSRDGGATALANLQAILQSMTIEARTPFGQAVSKLAAAGLPTDSQRCVCFTETPLEHIALLAEPIEGRQHRLQPYGIAITKKQARTLAVNPVWYIDITPGYNWLTHPVDDLIDVALAAHDPAAPIFRLTPFFEQMGTGNLGLPNYYRKEFWWEREWRHVGNCTLPQRLFVIAPEASHAVLRGAPGWSQSFRLLDPAWSLEQMIARVAGFDQADVALP